MSVAAVIEKIRQTGFTIDADGDYIAIEPFDELTVQQIEWLRDLKPDILDTLRSPGSVLEASQAGSDLEAANDRVAMTRVPELAQSTGLRNACLRSFPYSGGLSPSCALALAISHPNIEWISRGVTGSAGWLMKTSVWHGFIMPRLPENALQSARYAQSSSHAR
jgi:hypothetical protein